MIEFLGLTKSFGRQPVLRGVDLHQVAVVELFRDGNLYVNFGDDPFIVALDGAPAVKFSAWDYARRRCDELKLSFHAEAQ